MATASSSSTISPASSTAALVPRSVSNARSPLSAPGSRLLPSPPREPIESYALWQPILRASDQIVLYNPSSHAINIVPASLNAVSSSFTLPFASNHHSSNGHNVCPYCHRPMDNIPHNFSPGTAHAYGIPQIEMSPNYFQLLQDVNGGVVQDHELPARVRTPYARFDDDGEYADDSNAPSRRWSRVSIDSDSGSDDPNEGGADRPESLRSLSGTSFVEGSLGSTPLGRSTSQLTQPSTGYAQPLDRNSSEEPDTGRNDSSASHGYYSTFFREETRLGMGANGSVFLCQHVLNGIPLGHFAVKKIAVGESTSYLMEILREVRLHEKLHHRNIITYHHAWLESARFSSFGLAVPTLHVLMQWAELGSLDDLILQRLGAKSPDRETESLEAPSGEYQTREARIRAFRARGGGAGVQASGEARKEARRRAREMKAVHLLSAEEIRSLFGDVVAGLAFLHESSFLHLDLKPGNVLLTLDEGQLIPRAMLSDFGTAQDALQSAARERSGNTGTLEYCAPESLCTNQDGTLRQITSKSDMWSLGMILHKLVYFRLPWKNDEDMKELEIEIMNFQGFRANSENIRAFTQRRLPVTLCQLLSKLLDVEPFQRPGSDQVLKAIRTRQLDPTSPQRDPSSHDGVGPLIRRTTPPSRENGSQATRYDSDGPISGERGEHSSPERAPVAQTRRTASRSRTRRSDPVGEIQMEDITPRLLALDGPVPAARRVAGWVLGINVPRMLSRGFKSALLISKTVLLINKCAPVPPKVAALSLVIGLALMDMWTRRLRWSCLLLVAHLGLLWAASRELLCVDVVSSGVMDPEMEVDLEDEQMDEELDEEDETSLESGSSQMELEGTNPIVAERRVIDNTYGQPRLELLPTTVLLVVMSNLGIYGTLAIRATCKALNRFVADSPQIWSRLVARFHRARANILLMGADPVVMPRLTKDDLQEDILRCAFILYSRWQNPGFRARVACRTHLTSPFGINQILFVPDSMGRFFLAVGHTVVGLWMVEGRGSRPCRQIFPSRRGLQESEQILKVLVSRPRGSMIAYAAVQYTVKDSYRLRTEIYQLHLTPPGFGPPGVPPGVPMVDPCCKHDTEGALMAFTDYVLAYALGDAAQTILLCCWVTRQATRLATPVREWEVRWQHQSCRAVTIGSDVIVVVRDSTAEVYPRDGFTILDSEREPHALSEELIQGDFEYLPTTYATDIAVFLGSFISTPKVHIHAPRPAASVSEGWRVDVCVRVISVIGVARSSAPLSDPGVPYYVTTAKLYKTATPGPSPHPSGMSTPNVSNPPSPTHTAPSSPSHTHGAGTPLAHPERYKFVFHVHALQPQHPHLSYGPIVAGANGRGVMLVTNIGTSGGPRQSVVKFRHPSDEELGRMTRSEANPRPAPKFVRVPQAVSSVPVPVQAPIAPLAVSTPNHGHYTLPSVQQAPRPDPFGPLLGLMCPCPQLDVMRGMSVLWSSNDPIQYDMIAWDEGAGSVIVGSHDGILAVLKCV